MKKLILFIFILFAFGTQSYAQQETKTLPVFSACENVTAFDKSTSPDLGLILYSDDEETVWNALRLANYSHEQGDLVVIFVTGKAVDAFMKVQNDSETYHIQKISNVFLNNGGNIYLCATCAQARNTEEIPSCTITSIADMYQIVIRSKKVLTF